MSVRNFPAAAVLAALAIAGMASFPAHAVMPVVKTVPWVATNPLIPHTTYPGKAVRLKGTSDQQGANFQYTWDFGDGSPVASGTVTNKFAIEAQHTYTGPVGTVYTARLTVTDTDTSDSASKTYFVEMKDKTLDTEVNVAIDEGLWYLHKAMTRDGACGVGNGCWNSTATRVGSSFYSNSAANLNAFLVNGHLETGAATNPYTETAQRSMRYVFTTLAAPAIPSSQTNLLGTFNPDANSNGLGIYVNQGTSSYTFYQGGQIMDAIIASGTPNAIAPTGPANVVGRTYRDIVQDMTDWYSYCQYDSTGGGGWRYSCNAFPDNSAAQWGAIGLIGAEHFGATVPQIVKDWNRVWLDYSQAAPNPPDFTNGAGYFGYTGTSPIWGPFAVTPSGMVQMVMDGIGRGSSPAGGPSWEGAETYMRESWDTGSGASGNVKDYYYGLFSFTKSMLLHDPNGDGTPEPINCLRSFKTGTTKPDIDWYAADKTNNVVDSCSGQVPSSDGVARTLVGDQSADGWWYGHNYTGEQYYYETAQAIMMLNRTVFESGVPVAVAQAVPNPSVVGQTITLDGSGSFHQDSTKQVDSWQWDLDNDGQYDDASGPVVNTSFAALGNYPVGLRVTDDGSPEKAATTIVVVNVSIPPLAPTADADGPYNFCPQVANWFLDGTGSVNPDEGQHEGAYPGDTIQSYEWDLDGDGQYDDANGSMPEVKAFMSGLGIGGHVVGLRVTDTTGTSFPSSPTGDLSDTDSAQVNVLSDTDPVCTSCITNLAARPKAGKVQLTWTAYPGASSYNVYRGTISGGPYLKIGSTASNYSTYLDGNVVNGTTYYYVVRAAAANASELCQSNQASARPSTR